MLYGMGREACRISGLVILSAVGVESQTPQIKLSPLRNYEWRNMLRVNISQSTVFLAFCVVLQGSMILDDPQ